MFFLSLMMLLLYLAPAASAQAPSRGVFQPTRAPAPPPECEARVGYDRNTTLPGYLLPASGGPATCIPFTSVAAHPPEGHQGDYYVDEFTDARLRERWAECKTDKVCHERVQKQIAARKPPNKEYGTTSPRVIYLLGKIEEKPEVNLSLIRRPAFFARSPYHERIAEAESRTYTVEFTAPPDPYDRIHKNLTADIKLRGWYVKGAGVEDAKGGKTRSLIIMSGGGGDRVVAIDHPADGFYRFEPDGRAVFPSYPNDRTGAVGARYWREIVCILNKEGFDVLYFDRRGVGISGGFSDTNTLQQGRDLLKIVADLRTGEGMRALTPTGKTLKGRDAAVALRGGKPDAGLPVLLLGNSRGTMASGWAMTMNFDKDCSYDLEIIECKPPVGDKMIKGAILVAEYSSGVGYVSSKPSAEDETRGLGRDRGLFIAGSELQYNLVFFPSSAILAGIHKWPSAFFARGLWCYAAALEGTMDSYSRIKGLKELVVVRGPHAYGSWPAEEKRRVQERMVAYAKAVVLGHTSIPGGRTWSNMKELVATTSDVWEPSSRPQK
ncbi:MAG: hypothetical protein ACE14L_06945 [Terriglobales bacterium]